MALDFKEIAKVIAGGRTKTDVDVLFDNLRKKKGLTNQGHILLNVLQREMLNGGNMQTTLEAFIELDDELNKNGGGLNAEEIVRKELEKPEKKKRKRKSAALADKDIINNTDYRIGIRQSMIDAILCRLKGNVCSVDDIFNALKNHYRKDLNNERIKDNSLLSYSQEYIKFFIDHKYMTNEYPHGSLPKERSLKVYHLLNKKRNIFSNAIAGDKTISVVEKYLLDWGEKNKTDVISLDDVLKNNLGADYTFDALFAGMKKLEEKQRAKQIGPGQFIIRK